MGSLVGASDEMAAVGPLVGASDTQLSELICSMSALYFGQRGAPLVCEYPNIEVHLSKNDAKVANRYKVYIQEEVS